MDRADRSSRSMRLKAQADRLAVDPILDCERAASRRNPRDCDPTRWGRTAWRSLSLCRRSCAEHRRPAARFSTLTPKSADCGPKPNRQEARLPLEGTAGFFRLVIDAQAGFEMKHDPTIRTPSKRAAACGSINSPQRTHGVLLKPSYFTVIGHCLQESVFDDGRPCYVDYARDLADCFRAISWRIEHPWKPCARP